MATIAPIKGVLAYTAVERDPTVTGINITYSPQRMDVLTFA
jgi:hypothetical protein